MSNMKKMLESQQTINEAAKYIMEYFTQEVSYKVHLETMLSAQTQIISLMELVKIHLMNHPLDELMFETEEITFFLRNVHHYLQMLKPFIELAEERNDNKTE